MTCLARVKVWVQDERGLGLVESLVAVALLGVVVVAFIVALSTGTIAVREADEKVVAQSLVRAQLEEIKAAVYADNYIPIDVDEPGYTISVVVSPIHDPDGDTNIQKITVTISQDGEDILTVENYKVNR